MQKIVKSAAGTPEAELPAQGVTLSIPSHMAAPSHALVLREGPKSTRPRGRIPRLARLLTLVHHVAELLQRGAVEIQAEFEVAAPADPVSKQSDSVTWCLVRLVADRGAAMIALKLDAKRLAKMVAP